MEELRKFVDESEEEEDALSQLKKFTAKVTKSRKPRTVIYKRSNGKRLYTYKNQKAKKKKIVRG